MSKKSTREKLKFIKYNNSINPHFIREIRSNSKKEVEIKKNYKLSNGFKGIVYTSINPVRRVSHHIAYKGSAGGPVPKEMSSLSQYIGKEHYGTNHSNTYRVSDTGKFRTIKSTSSKFGTGNKSYKPFNIYIDENNNEKNFYKAVSDLKKKRLN